MKASTTQPCSNNRHCPQISPIQRTFDRNCKVHCLRFLGWGGGSWKWWRMVAVYAWSTSRRWAKVTLEEFIDGIMRCKGQAHLWQRRVISRREFWWCFVVFWNISTQVVCEMAFNEPLSLTRYSGFQGGQSGDFVTSVNMCFRVTDHFLIHQIEQRKHPATNFQSWGLNHFVSTWYFLCNKSGTFIFQNVRRDVWDRSQLEMFSLQKDGSFCQLAQNFQIYSWGNHAWFLFSFLHNQTKTKRMRLVD